VSENIKPVMKPQDLEDYLYEVFPELFNGEIRPLLITGLAPGEASLTMKVSTHHKRPGGTVSGPAMMELSDLALYAVILGHIGKVPLAVTTSLNFNFLRKPEIGDLVATARLLKLGKRLAVGEVNVLSLNTNHVVAHATGTYSIPPDR
jgi:uncharacterized protein (TIGR00369 family)